MKRPSLVIEKVSKTIGKHRILKELSFSLAAGEFCVLVGPSGCGKSTLLNLIAGLEPVSAGRLYFEGRDLTHLAPKERNLAMVFQSYALYPNMTVRENIAFGLKNHSNSKAEIVRRTLEAAQRLQLEALLERKPRNLSGGQRQRVAMGRAISRSPLMYLFDEPLSNLDAKLRVETRLQLKQLHQKENSTIVYVTHDQIEAMTLADKIVVMRQGAIQQIDTPLKVYHQPKNRFVAGFIGAPAMNFITVTPTAVGRSLAFELSGHQGSRLQVALKKPPRGLRAYLGRPVVLGLRPEWIVPLENSKRLKALTVKVDFVENTGADCYLFFRVNGVQVSCRAASSFYGVRGKTVAVVLQSEKAVFFDPQTELRLF